METDLRVCQAALARDRVLYLDLTEAVRRGDGRVVAALPHGALVSFHNYKRDGQELGFTMFADDRETAERLLALLPPVPDFITVHEALYLDLLRDRFGPADMRPCWQVGYLHASPPPLPQLGAEVRRLDRSHLPAVLANYALTNEGYLSWLVERGELYGAFDGDVLMAFVGRHAEGSIGLLDVLPPYRRRRLATLLQSYMIALELSRGHVPYGQVFDGNEPSLALQRSLGMERSAGQLYWAACD